MRFDWRRLIMPLFVLALLAVSNFIVFGFGMRAGAAKNVAAQVDRFERGKATLCDLDEDARLFVCPVMRQALPLPGGAALLYICDPPGTTGYVAFVGKVEPEAKSQATTKLLEVGLRVGPHCESSGEEILWVKGGRGRQWKTAAQTL